MGITASGIGSGLDINSLVAQLVKAESRPMALLQGQQKTIKAKISSYGQVSSALATFQTATRTLGTASQPGSRIALIAQIFPFSSPFAMAARGATDPALWPHLVAILWQLLWVAITIRITAALFRRGVLRTGPGLWAALWRRKG